MVLELTQVQLKCYLSSVSSAFNQSRLSKKLTSGIEIGYEKILSPAAFATHGARTASIMIVVDQPLPMT